MKLRKCFLPAMLLSLTLLCACSSDTVHITDQNGKSITVSKAEDDTYTFKLPAQHNKDATWFNPFIDVEERHWFYDAVRYCHENMLIRGTESNLFSPQTATTRAMVVSILWRLEGSPRVSSMSFTDVPASQYYTDAVAWASSQKIVSGYSEDTFCPDKPITREELAAILYRYASYNAWDTSAEDSLERFADAHTASAYAEKAMRWAYAQGIFSGMNNRMLAPKGEATRAQIASMLMRICEDIPS